MTNEEMAYLAGLIDGEGYLGIARSRTSAAAKGCKRGISYRLMLSVKMTDIRPLEFAHRTTGVGTVRVERRVEGQRLVYGWDVWSRQAAELIRQIRPWLLVKGEVADLCLEFQAAMRSPGRNGLSDEEWELRERLSSQVRELNY